MTFLAAGLSAPADHEYSVDAYGLDVSLEFVPVQPVTLERSGKVTWSTPEPPAVAVALITNEPEPPSRTYRVFVPAAQYWLEPPVTGVGAVTSIVGGLVSIFASMDSADGALWLPTLSETSTR